MQTLIQLVASIVGASIIGNQLNNPMLGVGVWFITYAIMPYTPRHYQ